MSSAWTSSPSRGRGRRAASRSATSRRPPRTGKTANPWHRISPKRAAGLKTKKHREAERLFLGEGKNLVLESPAPPVRLFETEEEVRRVSTLQAPTGPVGVFPFLDVSAERLFAVSSLVVLLHGVQDPGNVGTVVRSAHAFGAGVALSRGCADLYNPKTVRATMGSIFHAPIVRDVESVELLATAKRAGFTTVAAVPEGGEGPEKIQGGKVLLAVGAEGSGLPAEVIQACSSRVTLPSRAPSLNAAVAASILLYEAHIRVLG